MAATADFGLENIHPGDIGDDLSMDDEFGGVGGGGDWGSPAAGHRSSARAQREPLTPTLSLPDSFDGEYGSGGNAGGGGFNRDVEFKKLRAEAARMRDLLQDRSNMFRDLKISDALYQQLRLRPDHDLTTHELACLRSHEFSLAPRRELETARRTLQETQTALQELETRASEQEAQLSRLTRQHSQMQETHRIEMGSLEERSVRLQQRLREEMAARQENEEKVSSYDRHHLELQRVGKELASLQVLHAQQSQQLVILTQSEKDARAAERDSERSRELLVLDKAFLTQQLGNAETQRDQQTRVAEAATARALALELKASQLGDQLLNQQMQGRTGFDERMDRELARLREDSQRELDQLRAAHKDLMERENSVLKDAKAAAELQAEALRRQVASLQGDQGNLQQQLSAALAQKATEVSEVRAEIRLKTFELGSIGAALEGRSAACRQLEMELETVRGELAAHKVAFTRLETDTELGSASMRAQLQLAKERLTAYEALEEEIDGAVLRVAHAGVRARADGHPEGADQASADLLTTLNAHPTHPERRARQAMLLAQKLLEVERQRDEARAALMEKGREMAALQRQLELSKEALARTAQPTVYLVTKLRDEEMAHAQVLARVGALKAEADAAERARQAAVSEAQQLRARLAMVLSQRGEVAGLRDMVEALLESEPEPEPEHAAPQQEEAFYGGSLDTLQALSAQAPANASVEYSPRASSSPRASAASSSSSSSSPFVAAAVGLRVDTAALSGPSAPFAPPSDNAGVGTEAIGPSGAVLDRMLQSPSGQRQSGWHTRSPIPE